MAEGADYEVLYKKSGESDYLKAASELIVVNEAGDYICTILGISSGDYDVLIRSRNSEDEFENELRNINVAGLDRSGYAHFNNVEGIGAYNDDGTIKDNTQIIYVNNENKNTITAVFNGKTYTGLVDILQNAKHSTTPLLIRVSGKITTNQYDYKQVTPRLADDSNLSEDHFVNTFSDEYGENLVGLRVCYTDAKAGVAYNYITTKDGIEFNYTGTTPQATNTYNRSIYLELKGKTVYDDDTSINSIHISNAKNITIEGITPDAEIFQFGFGFNDCDSIEIKNLKFSSYPEDAVAFSASSSNSVDKHKGFWVLHCDFYSGLNNWDLTGEQDKSQGDGSIDINNVSNVTVSYCNFIETGKTCLIASNDQSGCMNVTHHHNYYYGVHARVPFARATNINMYNNYYDSCEEAVRLRVSCYGFSENNYFNKCTKAHLDDDDTTGIKSFNDIFVSTFGVQSTKVTERGMTVENSCTLLGKDYSRFDTDSELFYYDTENNRSDVSIDFCSRNATATDRYIIIYDENKNEIYRSHCADKLERTTFTFKVEPGKTYYIAYSNGLTYFSIY